MIKEVVLPGDCCVPMVKSLPIGEHPGHVRRAAKAEKAVQVVGQYDDEIAGPFLLTMVEGHRIQEPSRQVWIGQGLRLGGGGSDADMEDGPVVDPGGRLVVKAVGEVGHLATSSSDTANLK